MAARGTQMGSLLGKSVFRKLWLRIRQIWATHEHKKVLEEEYHMKTAEEAAKVMGNMKGVFMKLGQILSFANENMPPQAQAALKISERELEVLRELAAGLSNKEIAQRLSVSPNTVKTHVARLYEKLGARRRTDAILKARELGLLV